MGGRPLFSKAEDWTLTPEEAKRLTRIADELDTPWVKRKPYEDDPDEYIRIHRQAGCRCWHRGVGILVHGEGFSPAQIMEEYE